MDDNEISIVSKYWSQLKKQPYVISLEKGCPITSWGHILSWPSRLLLILTEISQMSAWLMALMSFWRCCDLVMVVVSHRSWAQWPQQSKPNRSFAFTLRESAHSRYFGLSSAWGLRLLVPHSPAQRPIWIHVVPFPQRTCSRVANRNMLPMEDARNVSL